MACRQGERRVFYRKVEEGLCREGGGKVSLPATRAFSSTSESQEAASRCPQDDSAHGPLGKPLHSLGCVCPQSEVLDGNT